jgi:hypothetical protein
LEWRESWSADSGVIRKRRSLKNVCAASAECSVLVHVEYSAQVPSACDTLKPLLWNCHGAGATRVAAGSSVGRSRQAVERLSTGALHWSREIRRLSDALLMLAVNDDCPVSVHDAPTRTMSTKELYHDFSRPSASSLT